MGDIDLYLGIAFVVVVILLYSSDCSSCVTCRESFIPSGSHTKTWEDWDNYAKDYGNTRDYWGQLAPGGGWTGSRFAPNNNTGGDVFYPDSPSSNTLSNKDEQQQEYLYKTQLLKSGI
jgi:hypothetical protein